MRVKFYTVVAALFLGTTSVYFLVYHSDYLSFKQEKSFQLSREIYQSPLGFSIRLPVNWDVINGNSINERMPELLIPESAEGKIRKLPGRYNNLVYKYYNKNVELYYPKESNTARKFLDSVRVRVVHVPGSNNPQWNIRFLQNGKSTFCDSALEGYRRESAKPVKPRSCTVIKVNQKYGYLHVVRFPDINRMQSNVVLRKSDQEIIYFTLYTYFDTEDNYYPLFLKMLRTVDYN